MEKSPLHQQFHGPSVYEFEFDFEIGVQWDDKVCMNHSWYLALDMQFFIISPVIVWLLWKFPKVGSIVAGLLTVAGDDRKHRPFSFMIFSVQQLWSL